MIQHKIISWYLKNKRDLPWRNTTNPYFIWLSEIILQQTRVAQGLPYYEKFIEKYPKIEDLANSEEDEVLRLWQGLGYYSRGRNLHGTAKTIVNQYKSIFPDRFSELLKLKGVGNYTAAAIASFAFKEAVPAIDGNAIRVISRIFKIDSPSDSPATLKQIYEYSEALIAECEPDLYNQAIMEMGATLCTPKKPSCEICPVQTECLSFPEKDYERIPYKAKRTKVTDREIHYLVLQNEENVFMKQRTDADIWQNLYDFPEFSPDSLSENINLLNPLETEEFPAVTHLLSHRRLKVHFVRALIQGQDVDIKDGNWYSLEEAEKLPKPKVIDDFLKKIRFSPS